MKININNLQNTIRLDRYLTNELKISRTKITKLIKDNLVFINSIVAKKPGILLKNGDFIEILEKEKCFINSELTNDDKIAIKVEIIFEDEYLIVINKPKFLLTHSTKYEHNLTLVNYLKDKINKDNFVDKERAGIVHRLDKNTSGLLIVAKTQKILDLLKDMIVNNKISRRYIAIVHNHFNQNRILIKAPLMRSINNTTKMVVTDDPKATEAITEIFLIKNLNKNQLSVIECLLHTGKTHQIRSHMQYIHHPIFNDPLYGNNDGFKKYDQFLISYKLNFIHPITKENMSFCIEPDKTFLSVIKDCE